MSLEINKVTQMCKDYFSMPTDNTAMGTYYDAMTPDLYDAMMGSCNYTEPDEIIKSVLGLGLDVNTCKVIDVGAGTGLVGTKLVSGGFKNIDAIDASEGLLGSLREK
jgi:2-polyprenyl-3-methyl-5-hydroxy-6-metoxy-1,4-benzoquinol methylase